MAEVAVPMAKAAPIARPKLHPLTSMRFGAAALVAFHHFALLGGVHPSNRWLDSLLGLGYVSVNFFFVLSGFVLAWNYIGDAGEFRVDGRRFWLARIARLYPAYALALIFALPHFIEFAVRGGAPVPGVVPLTNPWIVAATTITTPLLLQVWVGLLTWNAVAWSLSVEAFFYLTFPLIAPGIGRASRTRLIVLAVLVAAAPILLTSVVFASALGRSASWYEFSTLTEGFFYASPLIHWPEFALGVIVGRLFQLRSLDGRQTRWKPRYEYLAVGGTCVLLLVFGLLPEAMFVATMAPVFGWLIFSLAHGQSGLARVLSLPVLILLGNASYSLYLFHAVFIQAFVDNAKMFGSTWMLSWPAFVLCFLLTAAFTIVVFLKVEEPARDWILRKWQKRPALDG